MAGLALPSLKWLIVGALAAGIWVVYEEGKGPRPQERVARLSNTEAAKAASKRVEPPKAAVSKAVTLPERAGRPQPRPSSITTGSIPRPKASVRKQLETTARVRVRIKPKPYAEVVATLEEGHIIVQLAQSGPWRLVSVDGKAGWIHSDYLGPAPMRPKADVVAKTASAKAVKKP